MGSKSPSDDHPAPLSPSSGKFKLTRTARIKKLILRGHDSAEDRKPDRAAVKMSGERKIRSPGRILLKKQRGVGKKNTEPFGKRKREELDDRWTGAWNPLNQYPSE